MQLQSLDFCPLDVKCPEQVECMYEIRTHPEVARYLKGTPPSDISAHLNYLKNVQNKKFYIFLADGVCCGYAQATSKEQTIELGWAVHPDYWGRGIGSFAVLKMIELTRPLGKPITLIVQSSNHRAISLYLKHGFTKTSDDDQTDFWEMTLNG